MKDEIKIWIRKNWYRPVLHTIPFIVFLIVCFSILEIWVVGIDNEAPMEWNLFITIVVFGGLCWITLFMIYVEKWSEQFNIYKNEIDQILKKVKR